MNTINPLKTPRWNTASVSSSRPQLRRWQAYRNLPPAEARKVWWMPRLGAARAPACDIEERTITQDGMKVRITIVRPAGASGAPAFIFIHGGGWILGDFPTHERFVRDLVVDSGFTAVFVNYTPSPEAHYPTAINEIYAATKWVAANGDEIRRGRKRLAIVGNSVGGNMTAAVALMAQHKGGPELKCQMMLWPVTDANFETESYHEYAEGYFPLAGDDEMVLGCLRAG